MARSARIAAIPIWGLAGALAGAADGDPAAPAATRLGLAEPALVWESVAVLESYPPQFVAVLRAEMPTPGWTVTVDSVETDPAGRRIVVETTATPPADIVAQVLTPARVRVHLGSVPVGRYCLEVWMRREPSAPYRLAGSFVVDASDPAPPLEPGK